MADKQGVKKIGYLEIYCLNKFTRSSVLGHARLKILKDGKEKGIAELAVVEETGIWAGLKFPIYDCGNV